MKKVYQPIIHLQADRVVSVYWVRNYEFPTFFLRVREKGWDVAESTPFHVGASIFNLLFTHKKRVHTHLKKLQIP